MDSLEELLHRRAPKEPDEIAAIKAYVAEQFDAPASVGMQGETIVVTVHSASLANMLRLRLPALQKAAGTTKRIVLRIG